MTERLPGILSKNQILERVECGSIVFDPPLDSLQTQVDAVDIRLGMTFLVPRGWMMTERGREQIRIDPLNRDPRIEQKRYEVVNLEPKQIFEILPDEWVRGSSLQRVKVPDDLIAFMFPRSSISRDGLSVDTTGPVDAHYDGWLTIPMKNNTKQPFVLRPGSRVAQLVFASLTTSVAEARSRWAGVDVVQSSRPEKEIEETELIEKGQLAELTRRFSLTGKS